MKKRILSVLLLVSMCVAYYPGEAVPKAYAEEIIVYSEDFESTAVGELPDNVTVNIGSTLGASGFVYVTSDGGNKVLRSQHQTTASGTNSATITLPNPVTGGFILDANLKFGDVTIRKEFTILSPQGTAILTIGLDRSGAGYIGNGRRLYSKIGPGGAATEITAFDFDFSANQDCHFKFDMDTQNSTIYLTLDNRDPVAMDVSESGIAAENLGIGSMRISTYYTAAVSGTNRFFQIDNIVVTDKNEIIQIDNYPPLVSGALSDIYVKRGDTVTVDVTTVFTDPEEDTLTYTTDMGAITGGILTYTADTVGIFPVTVTASDVEGLTASDTFNVIVNDESGIDSLIYFEDFETTPVGGIPGNVNLNIAAAFDAGGGIKVANDGGNNVLRNTHMTIARGTNHAELVLPMQVYGDFIADLDLKFSDNAMRRDLIIYNPDGDKVLNIRHEARSNSLVAYAGSSTEPINTEYSFTIGQAHHFTFVMDSENEEISMTFDDSSAMIFDLSQSGLTQNKLGIGSIGISSYGTAAVANNRFFQIDNIIVRADFFVSDSDLEVVRNDADEFLWEYISNENIDSVTRALNLRTKGTRGSTITWSSSNESVISSAGMVMRQAVQRTVVLTATFKKGNATYKKTFTVTVMPAEPEVYKDVFFEDFESFTLGQSIVGTPGWTESITPPINEDTGIFSVTDPQKPGNKVMKGNNNHTGVQAYSGYTGIQDLPDVYDGDYELSFDFMVNQLDTDSRVDLNNNKGENLFGIGVSSGGSFMYRVDGKTTNTSAVRPEVGRWYKFKLRISSTTRYVAWFIDDTLVGTFRQTENVSNNYGFSVIRYYFWVRKTGAGTLYVDDIRIRENLTSKLSLVFNDIDFSSLADGVENDFSLLTGAANGAVINWISNNAAITIDGGVARVVRPDPTEDDVYVTLTAEASVDGATVSREYVIKVLRQYSDDEAVIRDADELLWHAMSAEPQDAVTTEVSLPKTGRQGTDIIWSANGNALELTDDKAVAVRGVQDSEVTLTATIRKSNAQTVKSFNVVVVRKLPDNLAYQRKVLSQSSQIYNKPVAYAMDDNFQTTWSTLYADASPFVNIDLGVKQPVDSIMLSERSKNIKSFKISASNDNLSYKSVYSFNKQTYTDKTETNIHSFNAVEARYFKIEIQRVRDNEAVIINEIQLYNSKLTDSQSVSFAAQIFDIYGRGNVSGNIILPIYGSHGTSLTYQTSDSNVLNTDGTVNRPDDTTVVNLTVYFTKGSATASKVIPVTVVGKNALAVPNNENYKTFNDVFTPMSNEAFFGLWNSQKNVWHIDYPGVFDYNKNPEMKKIGDYVKAGDYDTARSALVLYYKQRDIGYSMVQSNRNYALADLYINNIYSGSHTYVTSAVVPETLSEVSADISSYITKKGTYSLFIMQKYKHEAEVEFYSKEAGENAAVLEVEVGGKIYSFPVAADTYVSPDTNMHTNYGLENRLYVKETFADDPTSVLGGYGNLWTKDTKRTYLKFDLSGLDEKAVVTRATLKLYGKSAKGNSEVLIWREGISSWKEDEYTWYNTLNDTYSWNGKEIDWIYPSSMDQGGLLGQISRFYMVSTIVGAYQTTGDEYYAYHAIRQILSFIEGTKDYVGFGNLQATGIRAGSLVVSFNHLLSSPHLTDDAAITMLQYFWQMSKTLSLDSYFRADHNHGIFANRGLMRLTLYFTEFSENDDWHKLFIDRYNLNLNTLVYADGAYREATSLYTSDVANNLLMAINESKTSNFELDPFFVKKTSDLTMFLAHILSPTGGDPGYGDAEIGVSRLSVVRSISEALNIEKAKYIYTNGREGEHPGFTSKVYPDGRYLVMRDGYDRDAWLMHTNWGIGDGRSHTHSDNLSLILYAYGKWLVADPGRFNYTDNPISNWLRYSTEAHNVVNINNSRQPMSSDTLNSFVTNDRFDFFTATSKAIPDNAGKELIYQRSVLFSKSKLFVVSDKLAPTDTTLANTYDQNWHFLPESNLPTAYTNGSIRTRFASGADLIISQADSSGVAYVRRDGYFSSTSQQVDEAEYATFRQVKTGVTTFDTVLYPVKEGEKTKVTTNRITMDVPKVTATALDIEVDDSVNVYKNIYYMTYETTPSLRTVGNLTYDGKAMLVEYSASGKIDSISMIDGKELTSGGTTVVKAKSKVADMFINYNWDEISIQSGSLNENTIVGLEILTERKVNAVKLNGKSIAFYQNGNKVIIGSVVLNGENKLTVTAQGSQKVGTTSTDYENALNYSYKNNGYAVTLNVAGQTKISGASSWDGTMPKLQTGTTAQAVNGDIVQVIAMDNKNLTFDTPYSVKIYKNDSVLLYQSNYKKLSAENTVSAKNSLTSNEVGIYSGSGYVTLYAYKPIDIILYKEYEAPPAFPSIIPKEKDTSGGGGGGGGGASGGGISVPIVTEPNGNDTNPAAFNDIDGHWAKNDIEFMRTLGVAVGDNGNFKPDNNITRAEFIAFVVRLLGYNKEQYSATFDDVSDNDWFAIDVLTAYKYGLIAGYDNRFRPNDLITREESAVILSKLITAETTTDTLNAYADKSDVSEWAVNAMATVIQNGIISGVDKITLAPKSFTTRAMAITMLTRLYKGAK